MEKKARKQCLFLVPGVGNSHNNWLWRQGSPDMDWEGNSFLFLSICHLLLCPASRKYNLNLFIKGVSSVNASDFCNLWITAIITCCLLKLHNSTVDLLHFRFICWDK